MLNNACLLLVLSCVWCVQAWERGDLEKYGPFQLALHSNLIKCEHDRNLKLDVSEVNVYFYDFSKNDHEIFTINNAASGILSIKKLDKNRKYVFFVPGYKSNITRKTEERVRDTFRTLPNSYLIILDHSTYTNDRQGHKKSYERSVKYVHYIGKALAGMLTELKKGGISPRNIHCIGHSLGSQILGYTGQIFFENTGAKIARVTALDPAGPCFSDSFIEEQIRSGVAEYVEVYHCNAGEVGTTSVLGDVDFYANNNGESQPNCHTTDVKDSLIPGVFDFSEAARCSHMACIQIYTATVNNPTWFLAWKCDTYKSFKDGQCPVDASTKAGYWNPGTAKGVYYFSSEGYDIDRI